MRVTVRICYTLNTHKTTTRFVRNIRVTSYLTIHKARVYKNDFTILLLQSPSTMYMYHFNVLLTPFNYIRKKNVNKDNNGICCPIDKGTLLTFDSNVATLGISVSRRPFPIWPYCYRVIYLFSYT